MSRLHHRPEAVEVIEVMAMIPTTRRKAVRVARIRQGGIDLVELRAVNLDPEWQTSVTVHPTDHRTVIRSEAVGRVVAALQAAQAKMEGRS